VKLRKVRCYRGLASARGKFSIEVLYTVAEMYLVKLYSCVECGEIFVIDFENPNFAGKTADEIADDQACPKCGKPLRETILPYPENFRTDDGGIGHFVPSHIIPPDAESFVKQFIELD
jgi:DNA-directed RNA polymerase subunit RPC12/RpoP